MHLPSDAINFSSNSAFVRLAGRPDFNDGVINVSHRMFCAGGKMGIRLGTNLKNAGIDVRPVEVSDVGHERLKSCLSPVKLRHYGGANGRALTTRFQLKSAPNTALEMKIWGL